MVRLPVAMVPLLAVVACSKESAPAAKHDATTATATDAAGTAAPPPCLSVQRRPNQTCCPAGHQVHCKTTSQASCTTLDKAGVIKKANEKCDSKDNDCAGQTDNGT